MAKEKQELWTLEGSQDSDFSGTIFGIFTSEDLAKEGKKELFDGEVADDDDFVIVKSNLPLNCISYNDKLVDIAEIVNKK